MKKKILQLSWLIGVCISVHAQSRQNILVPEKILKQITTLTTPLPATINEAYQMFAVKKQEYDSLELMTKAAFSTLADKMQKRSLILNSLAGYQVDNATRYIIPANQQFADFFIQKWDAFDVMGKTVSRIQSFYGKELYKSQGYLVVWDSVYRSRLPVLSRYRDEVLKLVQTEIAYLKANQKMFTSSDESTRMQYVEAEAKVLQKLIYLKDKWHRVIIEDGVEKVQFCKDHPENCRQQQ